MLTELKRQAFEANLLLPRHGLVHLNFGNASAFDRGRRIFAIKPSGIDYDRLRPADMVLVDLAGKRVEGRLRPRRPTRRRTWSSTQHLILFLPIQLSNGRGPPHCSGCEFFGLTALIVDTM